MSIATLGAPLAPRELETIHLLARGRTYKEVAAAMSLSVQTVKRYARDVLIKTGATNRIEALNRLGWIVVGPATRLRATDPRNTSDPTDGGPPMPVSTHTRCWCPRCL